MSVGLTVPDADAFVCAKLLEIYLNKNTDRHLEMIRAEDGSLHLLVVSDAETTA